MKKIFLGGWVDTVLYSFIFFVIFSAPAYASGLTQSADFSSASNQYLSVPSGSATALDVTGGLTILAWVKFNSLPSMGNEYNIVSKGNNSNANSSYEAFSLDNPAGTQTLFTQLVHNSGTDAQKSVNWTPSVGVWYQVALVYTASGSSDMLFYVNGVQQGSSQSSGFTSLNSNSSTFYVGAQGQSTPVSYFDGEISQVAVFNTGLSSPTIANYYCHQFTGSESNIVGLWNLNGTTTDSTSNANNLTNNNGVSFVNDAPTCLEAPTVVRKPADQLVFGTSTLQNDNDLQLSLDANQTYIIDGVIFASATTTATTPDIILGFSAPSGSTVTIGVDKSLLTASSTSPRFVLPADNPRAIHIQGTVTTGGTSGVLQLQWAQSTPDTAATSVLEGSYLREEEL